MRALLPLLVLTWACDNGDTTDKTDATDATDDVTDTGDTDEPTGDTGPVGDYTIAASLSNATNNQPFADPEGLCTQLLDPTSIALGGKDYDVVATGTVAKDGTLSFTVPVDTKPALGMLINIDDCPKAKDDRVGISTNTGVLPGSYEDAEDGDTVAALAYAFTPADITGLGLGLASVGYTGDLAKDGFIYGFTLESLAPLTPAGGIVLGCGTCDPEPTFYYIDADAKNDGPFAQDGAPNTATGEGVGIWIGPGGPIGTYTATDPDGKLTFEDQLNGSAPGSAVVTAFIAE